MDLSENPVVLVLKDYDANSISKDTGLSRSVCHKILTEPLARVRPETADIIHVWVEENLGPIAFADLFHPSNIIARGRLPLTGHPIDVEPVSRMIICEVCRLETPRSTACVNCEPDARTSSA